jgi:hypothetical protein
MRDEIYPGAQWNPGRNAGYNSGRSSMAACVCHYTVGKNSAGIGLDGYFHWLVSRDGRIEQYAEADAITWAQGEANGVGPSIEVEFLDEPEGIFTDAARDACAGLIHWLADEWGIPLDYYDGDRIPPAAMRGFVAHRSIQQSEGHSDYWPRPDWDRMVAGTQPAPGPQEEDRMQPEFMASKAGAIYVYDPNNHTKTHVGDPEAFDAIASYWKINGVNADVSSNDTTEIILRDAANIEK